MSRIFINEFENFISKSLKEMQIGQSIEFYTFKKDRMVSIIKKCDEKFEITEFGFNKQIYENLDFKHSIKMLERIKKIEFPRSNVIYFYKKEN